MKVSVVMVTHNHEKYIAKAIEGILMQNCDFEVELIIGDDCSPDGIAEIVKKYIDTHPNGHWINYTRHEINKGMMPNFIWTLEHSKGKYIALCDGDDYWTDPYKLQKQVDFLEANPDVSIICHDAIVVDSEGKKIEDSAYTYPNHKSDFSSDELMKCTGNVLTLTMCFRNVLSEIPKEMKKAFFGDTFLTSLLGQYGGSKFLPEKMAAYRQSGTGVYSGAKISDRLGNSIRTYIQLSKYYKRLRNKKLKKHFLEAARQQNRQHIYYSVEEKNKKQLIMALKDNFFLPKSHTDKLDFVVLLKVVVKNVFISRK